MVGRCRQMFFIALRGHLICPWTRRNSGLIDRVAINKALSLASKAGSAADVVYLYQNDLIALFVSFIGRLDERT